MMDTIAGKRLLIVGLARQGIALARFAVSAGAQVIVTDLQTVDQLADATASLEDLAIEYVLGAHPIELLDRVDIVALSGGVAADSAFALKAKERGIPLTNDSLEFLRRVPARTVGITGSAGKTTTTALTGEMCRATGRTTWIGGNIGKPLIGYLGSIGPEDLVIQELSSFQLELWDQSPSVAAVLNLTPNHLDRHHSFENYARAKANIFTFQDANGTVVLGADDPSAMSLEPLAHGRVRLFSLHQPVFDGAYFSQGHFWLRDTNRQERICSQDDVGLRGLHNVSNILAAIVLADCVGVPVEAMRSTIRSFTGVPHRLEPVQTVRGVQYVNDSIATAPERAVAALKSFDEPLILLAGGRDKEMVWDSWARSTSQRVKAVILFGELQDTLMAALTRANTSVNGNPALETIRLCDTLEEAVRAAASLAQAGDVVLLSPGGTSFDAFKDFAARGEAFRELVSELAEGS